MAPVFPLSAQAEVYETKTGKERQRCPYCMRHGLPPRLHAFTMQADQPRLNDGCPVRARVISNRAGPRPVFTSAAQKVRGGSREPSARDQASLLRSGRQAGRGKGIRKWLVIGCPPRTRGGRGTGSRPCPCGAGGRCCAGCDGRACCIGRIHRYKLCQSASGPKVAPR
jgi:hypothetical protein